MADTPIDIDFNNMFANPDIYAEQYSEGSQSLYKLLTVEPEKRIGLDEVEKHPFLE